MEKNWKEYLTPPILLIIFLLALSLFIMMPVMNMVILGAILALGIRPIGKAIQKKLKYSSASIIIAIILVIIPLIILLIYIIVVTAGFISDFVLNNPSISNINETVAVINQYLPVNGSTAEITAYLEEGIKQLGNYILNYIVKLAGKIANLSLDLFVLICSTFYFARDGDRCFNFIKSFVPQSSIQFFDETINEIKSVLKSIFYGHFLTSLIIGIIAGVGYSLLGYSYGVFLGVITGIFQLIPVVGPWPIYWALAIMDAIGGNYVRVVVVLLFGFFLSLSDMYIRPALSSHYADIPPLVLLIGFLSGPLAYGIVGFIVGPLILGITYAILISYKKNITNNSEEDI